MGKLIWTGARASDVQYTGDLIGGSITIFGENDGVINHAYCANQNIRLNHNNNSPEASMFILHRQLEMIDHNPGVRFMSYNPNCVFGADERVVSRTVCLNDETLMKTLDNKIAFREWVQGIGVPLLDYRIVKGCKIRDVIALDFSGCDVVVQNPCSSGGEGTYVLGMGTRSDVEFLPEQDYIISQYAKKNVPINVHCVIYDNDFLVLPPSVQLIVNADGLLLYRGADFIEYANVDVAADVEFRKQVNLICGQLLEAGYRGVLGIDAMISDGALYVQEVNNRFQGSTYPLNMALRDAGLPSVQELNYRAFFDKEKPKDSVAIETLKVPYSYFVFAADCGSDKSELEHAKYMYHKIISKSVPEAMCYKDDGLSFDADIELRAPLFEVVFRVNISSIVDEGVKTLRIHPSLVVPPPEWKNEIRDLTDLTALKTSLINEGVTISSSAKAQLYNAYGLQEYFSLDFIIGGKFYVNCLTSLKLIALSPFSLDYDDNGFILEYYGKFLARMEYVHRFTPPQKLTMAGVSLPEIVYFATDRLRLQNSSTCFFGSSETSACRFCEIFGTCTAFDTQDILDAIDECFAIHPLPFRHILIGGRSHAPKAEREVILSMCERIRKYSHMPIYLMCLPPERLSDISDYIDAGVTEFGFNMEVFDRRLAATYMPGKGLIPIERYLAALAYAAERSGRNGQVRCAFIVGLEPLDSLLAGVDVVCKVGAAPILSAFRPMFGTPMQNVVQTSSVYLTQAANAAEEICKSYGLSLGPQCGACQNNTLNILKEQVPQ